MAFQVGNDDFDLDLKVLAKKHGIYPLPEWVTNHQLFQDYLRIRSGQFKTVEEFVDFQDGG